MSLSGRRERMADTQYIDWLTWRTHLFERCYLKGFNNHLLNVTLDTDDVLNRHIHFSDGDVAQKKLDGAEARMRQNVDKLRAHYVGIPFSEFEVDSYADHLCVLRDLAAVTRDNVKSIVYGQHSQPAKQGAKPRYANFEKGLGCCIDSVMRCMAVDGIEGRVLSNLKDSLPVIADSGMMVAQSKEAREVMGEVLVRACEDMEKGLSVMLSSRACDTGFAPLVVARYLLEDYDYWVGDLMQSRTAEAYDHVNLLSSGIRQVGYIYRAKFDFVLKKLQRIDGYENFEVVVKDSEGNSFASTDVNKI
jgi:hypothetical protein